MKPSVWLKSLLLGAAVTLSACGGGGGGSDDTFTPPSQARISASAQSTSVPASSTVSITVNVTLPNGSPAADGTVVSSSLSPASLGGLFGVLNGQTAGTTSSTVGGRAEFVFVAGAQQGTVTATFSTQPAGQASAVSTSVQLTVTAPTPQGNISIQATRTQLPLNLFGVRPFFGSPYLTELVITARSASGQPISIPKGEAGGLAISVNPVTIAAYSTLDDPETEDDPATPEIENNEFLTLMGQGPINIVSGRATVFIHSFDVPGSAVITATIQDPDTNRVMTATQTINVVSATPPLPTVIQLFPAFSGIYVQGSGGATSGTMEVNISDANGQPVPDPTSGNAAFNNYRVEVIGDAPAAAGERVNGLNAAGQNVSGQAIALRTNNGVGGFSFTTGNRQGQTTIRVTADRADNNVDNGISDPVVAERTIAISDGRLFALQLTSPNRDAIFRNGVVGTDGQGNQVVRQPDGTYSLTVSAIATDRQGNPVLPGTQIEFGLIDSPLVGFPNQGSGDFAIGGLDGNPQENGLLFTAPTGTFRTSAGGAGPGDTLLVFGQAVDGNRDLESARTIQQINSQTSLSVVQRFNRNDDTGNSVDNGNVLPYIIGRAAHGNITATATTDANGVATTLMNYPVSRLGQAVAVWARGGATSGSTQKLVTDISDYVYPGIAPVTIIASPNVIPGNTTASVVVCLRDAFDSPIQGAFVNFGFSLESGSGSIGGRSSGPLPQPTGSNGCATVSVVTSGMSEDGENLLRFSLGDAEPAEVEIQVAGDLVLQASPTAFIGNGSFTVQLRLIDGAGNPVANRAISVECSGTGETAIVSVTQPPALTNASGQSSAVLTASQMDQPDGGAEWECEFSLGGNDPTATVIFKGRDSCAGGDGFSPPALPGDCEGDESETVVLTVQAGGSGNYSILSIPSGLSCTHAGGATATSCASNFTAGNDVTLVLTSGGNPYTNFTVSGACSSGGGNTIQVPGFNQAATCVITGN
jgi:hypothetical protein